MLIIKWATKPTIEIPSYIAEAKQAMTKAQLKTINRFAEQGWHVIAVIQENDFLRITLERVNELREDKSRNLKKISIENRSMKLLENGEYQTLHFLTKVKQPPTSSSPDKAKSTGSSPDWKIGDRVCQESAPGKTGAICEIGTGDQDGRLRVQWGSRRTWIKTDRLRRA